MHFENPPRQKFARHAQELVEVSSSCFVGSSGVEEYHFMLKPIQYGRFADQLEWLSSAMSAILEKNRLGRDSVVFRRFFCSDLANRIDELRGNPFSDPDRNENGIVSLVTQPPEPPAKVSLWVYCIKGPDTKLCGRKQDHSYILSRGDLEHIWTTGYAFPGLNGSYKQTHAIFDAYNKFLEDRNLTLEDNCVRTWFFVKDVDTNYNGMVVARNEVFVDHDLVPSTHYIASTGIEGSFMDVHALVMMDAYAIKGLRKEQIEYIQALDHLSHTHVYGVAFERATSIAYADRKHIIVSGTASIDKEGEIVHVGDVLLQLDRTLDNINALLSQAGATMDDMQQFVVYLRDPSDVEIIRDILKERIGDMPFLVVTAPVCRPSWLVEIEGVAVIQNQDDSLPAF